MENMTPTQKLSIWYANNCDEEWEHLYGITIGTVDNPGWSLKIDLEETTLDGVSFASVKQDRTPTDWIICHVKEHSFYGYGGPGNLDELILIFLEWASKDSRKIE